MSNVDERVVKMSFDNAQFQAGVQTTLAELDALNKALKLQGASKGLSDLGTAANGIKLDGIGAGIDAIKSKFSVMSIIGITALTNIASKAVDAGLRVAKSFTIEPIKAGFANYETQINAVQTILANTGLKGKAGLQQVTGALDELNTYANKTIYNFSEMAKNVGTFTAAGVKLDVAKDAIQGIANLAALSGSNSEQASTAMYQLSQAIAANKVGLQDWNSVVNAGLGGAVFQKALYNTGVQLGTIKNTKMGQTFEEWTKAGNSFRGSLKDGWLTGKVLTSTLSQFTGNLTDAQLKSQGYNADQIKQIQELAKVASGAATNIKTFSQLTQALKEEVATAYASVFKTIFGDINGATALFTPLHNILENLLTGPIYALNNILKEWVKLGGKIIFLDTLKLAAQELGRVIKPIKEAFRDIFPATTGAMLVSLTKGLHVLVEGLNISETSAKNLRKTFAGVFALFDIGWQLIKQTAEWLGSLLGPILGKGSGGLLTFTGTLGEMLVHLDKIVKKGVGLNQFFMALGRVLSPVIGFLGSLVTYMLHFADMVPSAFSKLTSWLQNIGNMLKPVYEQVKSFFHNLFGSINFDDVLKVVETGLFAALALSLKRLFDHLRHAVPGGNPFSGLISSITEPFEQLTNTLKSMQKALNATIILEIALAVAALTVSVIELSKIKDKDLQKALGALGTMFIQLFVALAAFNRIGGAKGLISTGTGLILIAAAIRVLVSSVQALSGMSWEELKKGMAGVGALLAALIITVRGMSGQAAGMATAGVGIVLIAAAIKILVSSVQDFSKMNWTEIKKGLAGVGGLLLSLALYTRIADISKGGIISGAGIVLLATGIKILASASQDFAKMNWNNVGKGLVAISGILLAVAVFSKTVGNPLTLLASGIALNGIAASMLIFAKAMGAFGKISWQSTAKGLLSMGVTLGIVAAAMNAMPPQMLASSLGLIAIAEALVIMSKALGTMGKMSWGEIAKGLVTLAGALTIIAVAVIFMESSLSGAAAILVVSAALILLSKAMATMGAMSWGEIARSLTTLAGAFIILGVAGLALTPVTPTLIALGIAITLMGVGVGLLGLGILALSAGLTGLAVSGAAGANAIGVIFKTMIALLPQLATALGTFLVNLSAAIIKATPAVLAAAIVLIDGLLKAIGTETPKILATFLTLIQNLLLQLVKNIPGFLDKATKIILAVLTAITQNAPKIISAFVNMIATILNALAANLPKFIGAAANLIASFLYGIAANLGKVISAGADLIIKFIEGIGSNALKIIDAAAKTIISFLNGLADAIDKYLPQIIDAGARIAGAIVDGLINGLEQAAGRILDAVMSPVKDAWNGVKSFLGIHSPSRKFMQLGQYITQGLIIGLSSGQADVVKTFSAMNDNIKNAMNGLKSDIDAYSSQLYKLQHAQKQNGLAIFFTSLALQQARSEYAKTAQAYKDLRAQDDAQYKALRNLGRAYDAIGEKLATANDQLKNATQIRDDYNKSVKDQTSQLPDITEATQLGDYVKSVTYQVNDLKKFTDVLAQLRKLGLNDAIYKELVAKGPASLNFAEQLLAGGADAVKKVDSLSDQLGTAAGSLGDQASKALYQAGVDSAQGLVDGLKKQQAAIQAQMEIIAAAMVAKIKHDLGIKSPSKVFALLGEFVTQGLATGLKNKVSDVVDATAYVGKTTLDAMSQALSGASDLIANNTDMTPVIAPVVDLSNVAKGVTQLGSMLSDKQLNIAANVSTAKDASAGYLANKIAAADAVNTQIANQPAGDITFIQNNNSPKALTSAEIYRQTNNQLSRAKGALTASVA